MFSLFLKKILAAKNWYRYLYKIYKEQDHAPDADFSRGRIRIRYKIVWIRNIGVPDLGDTGPIWMVFVGQVAQKSATTLFNAHKIKNT
jgi:hypothetical protein